MRRGRRTGSAVALAAAALLLVACDDSGPLVACKVDPTTEDLIQQREAAGIADCDPADWAAGDGEPADLPDVELDCLGSTTPASLADVRGPAVINVWSSNCEPCRAEMPALQEFSAAYGDQVNVVGLNFLDTYPGAAIDLAARSDVTYPSAADACGDLQETDLVLNGLPIFLFVAPDGTVTQQHGGVDSVAEIVELTEEKAGVDLVAPERQQGNG